MLKAVDGVYDRNIETQDEEAVDLKDHQGIISNLIIKSQRSLSQNLTILMRLIRIQPSPFKGRNIVDLDFMYKQLLDGHKSCSTILSLTQYQRD